MATEHDLFETPDNRDVKLWRFMSLPKFLSLLDLQSIYFPRADLLGDPLEGTVTQMTQLVRQQNVPEFATGMSQAILALRKQLFVSCWHENDHESAAFWGLFVCILQNMKLDTTFQSLLKNLSKQSMWLPMPNNGLSML